MNRQRYGGFTLIEILVVVGLIAILAAITIVAINPAKNFESTRNTQRSSDISAILNAVTQYTSESGQTLAGLVSATGHEATLPTCDAQPATNGIDIINDANGNGASPTTAQDTTGTDDDEYLHLERVLVSEYIVAIPEDPNFPSGAAKTSAAGGTFTGYQICGESNGRVQIVAPGTEPTATATDLYVVR